MKKIKLNDESDQETKMIERRNFLRYSVVGGVAAAFAAPASIYATAGTDVSSTEFKGVSAADLLAVFARLAWALPNKLKAAADASEVENKIYKDFNTLYKELVDLAKQLKIKCDAVSRNDPRLQEIFELTKTSQDNIRYIQSPSTEESEIAYLQLATVAAAAQQVARSANEILPVTVAASDPDNKIICQMLSKIEEMQTVKKDLDVARKNSQDLFNGFVDSIGALNRNILDASEAAAKADRGELSKEPALKKIDDAEAILDRLTKKSLALEEGRMTPEQLRLLIGVPKAMLKNELPGVSERRQTSTAIFQNASYTQPERADTARGRIERIIADNIRPSGGWTVYLLAVACLGVLHMYREKDEGTRRSLINNALQSVPLVEPNSNFSRATSSIVSIRV